jgi:hypothetical protein
MSQMDRDQPATRGHVYDARDSLRDELRGEIREMEARLNRNIAYSAENVVTVLRSDVRAEIGQSEGRLRADFASMASSIVERVRDEIRVLDDQYRDLPPRVDRLEQLERERGERERSKPRRR